MTMELCILTVKVGFAGRALSAVVVYRLAFMVVWGKISP
jgi:hypothetical protein